MKLNEVNRSELSPMMQQYAEIKDNYIEELVFFRLGDFYELFFEDAVTASRELELTLTGKVAGLKERVPMCGVPHHAVKNYLEKLLNKGYKVAIAEQLEDPKNVKGVVKRGVVEVVSKGTIADFELLNASDSSYIASIIKSVDMYILTYLDISTGSLNSTKISLNEEVLINEILSLNIKELILVNNLDIKFIDVIKNNYGVSITYHEKILEENIPEFLENYDARTVLGVKHLFCYLEEKLLKNLEHINSVNIIDKIKYLEMDVHSIRNLELVETIRLKERTYSLLWLLDKTKTAAGSRKLKSWILSPLKDKNILNDRYEKISKLNTEFIHKENLRNALFEIYDLERLIGKLVNGSLNARDLLQLKNSFEYLPEIKKIVHELKFDYDFSTHKDLFELLNKAINLDAPITIKDGGMINKGYNEQLDELKTIRFSGKEFVANFEKEIKEKTGIKTLKVGYNKVFGYYIEVSKGSVKDIKEEYGFERRQTLAGAERYISPELKEKESIILGAEEKINELEYELFLEIKEIIKKDLAEIKKTAEVISEIDVLSSFAQCADEYKLVRPIISDNKKINIVEGRHPVVEALSKKEYVPNDCYMDELTSTLLLTGPNMAGKSTYMRQLAIIIIMAQIGSFVPAKSAEFSIIDKIYTRIGASDDLVSGESTFMVEMKEAKNAICGATENSLILFDELGRGTATYDGMSLARAILEYTTEKIKCFTLFSTHYHELTVLDKEISNIKNIHVSAVEDGNKITFLHKIKNGPVDKSYGIHVALLAELPSELIKRASEILFEYESAPKKNNSKNNIQMALPLEEKKKEDEVEKMILDIDIINITPMEAMNKLFLIKEKIERDKK